MIVQQRGGNSATLGLMFKKKNHFHFTGNNAYYIILVLIGSCYKTYPILLLKKKP